jgi:hypothetical protein
MNLIVHNVSDSYSEVRGSNLNTETQVILAEVILISFGNNFVTDTVSLNKLAKPLIKHLPLQVTLGGTLSSSDSKFIKILKFNFWVPI